MTLTTVFELYKNIVFNNTQDGRLTKLTTRTVYIGMLLMMWIGIRTAIGEKYVSSAECSLTIYLKRTRVITTIQSHGR
jgi:hypothetical protein